MKKICSITLAICRRYSNLPNKRDPGIYKRSALVNLKEFPDDFQDMDLDDLEADFMDSHKSYKQHVREEALKRERLKYLIVKNKYFKEKYPNFLTWSDKEQMKFLHNSDPEEWTVDKLSESFPALPDVVKKVIKAKFSKSDTKKHHHDVIVEQNWKDFRNGKLKFLPTELVEHLKKFTARKIQTTHIIEKKQEVVSVPKVQSEFSEIITSYQKFKSNKTNDTDQCEINTSKPIEVDVKVNPIIQGNTQRAKDTFVVAVDKNKLKNQNLLTLSKLQSEIEMKAKHGLQLTEQEKLIFKENKQNQDAIVALHQENIKLIDKEKFNSSTGMSLSTKRDYSHLNYPENIIIPKELKKRGYTYKLNDCYYDDDGQFLYRVPGME